jgi:1-deoxy-D-xylulose-5-phosphate synthase
MTPANENETRIMLTTAYNYNGPATVRYPRGSGPNIEVDAGLPSLEIGKANLVREGSSDIIFLNFGSLLHEAIEVSESLDLTLIDM